MANEKISSFDDLATAGITLSQVEGVAAYYDNGGTLTNVKFSGNDIISTVGGLPGVLAVNDTATAGQEIKILDFAGFNPITYKATGIESSPLTPITITAKGNLTLEATSANTTMSLYNLASAGTGSILISNRQTNGELELDTDGELKITLPSAPSVGDVLSAKDVNGNVEWVTPSAGGSSAFTTLVAGNTIDWDYVTDGPNIKITLGAGLTNIITVDSIGEFPDGSEGWMIIDPSASTDYKLPDEDYGSAATMKSLLPDGDVSLGANPVLFHYTYDGTTFYWTKFKNMLEALNYPPSIEYDTSNLLMYHNPKSFNQAVSGSIAGLSDIDNLLSNSFGDMTTSSNSGGTFEYYVDGNAEPNNPTGAPFYSMGGTSSNRIVRASDLGVAISNLTTFSGWIQGPYNLASSYQTLVDFDGGVNYEQAMYLDNGDFVYSFSPVLATFTYPELTDHSASGGADLSTEWIFVNVCSTPATGPATNDGIVKMGIGCKSSLDWAIANPPVAPATTTNWDWENGDGTGATVPVNAEGMWFEEFSGLDMDEFDFNNVNIFNGIDAVSEDFVGHLGIFGIFTTALNETEMTANFVATRDNYYV